MQLTFSTTSIEVKKVRGGESRQVNKEVITTVEYNEADDDYECLSVNVYEDGIFKTDISGLLDEMEGNLLNLHLEAIDWREQFINKQNF